MRTQTMVCQAGEIMDWVLETMVCQAREIMDWVLETTDNWLSQLVLITPHFALNAITMLVLQQHTYVIY